ncbi:MAG: hypothetical protein KGO48_14470 [Alphaproteobacteria bacterium]|nr:hypothetical protein [Alphaproteobacteria bacterium]
MRNLAKTGAAILMLTGMAGNVMAATQTGCARPTEMAAVKTAAIQQRLMVAALSCDAAKLYNSFVSTYQKDLQASDRDLQNFFRRLHGKNGTEEYHAFKTKLANASSMASIGDITGYCASANQLFDDALNSARSTLAAFVAARETPADTAFEQCQGQVLTAGNTGAIPPAFVPVPRSKPVDVVLPAQGRGLAAPH